MKRRLAMKVYKAWCFNQEAWVHNRPSMKGMLEAAVKLYPSAKLPKMLEVRGVQQMEKEDPWDSMVRVVTHLSDELTYRIEMQDGLTYHSQVD